MSGWLQVSQFAGMTTPDPPTDPPEWPEPTDEDGPCELCRRYLPLYDTAGERVGLSGYEAPGACMYDERCPALVDGAKLGRAQDCEVFERRGR